LAKPTDFLKASSERIAAEQKWYALTGRGVELRAEEDGDIHIALADATADKPGVVVPEIPAKPQWYQLRQIVFGLDRGPVSVLCELRSKTEDQSTANYNNYGKTFFDIGHAPTDQSNLRRDLQGYAAWEIHRVMNLRFRLEFSVATLP